MSTLDAATTQGADGAQSEQDLGPLAWVLDELRKSLDGAAKAMRRFVRDAEIARESDLAALDAGPLRIARQQLHQAGGALEMVGMAQPALVLRAMEAAVQRFVQRPELCSDAAAATIERASFALIEYLDCVLAGKAVSPVALFPQYRDAQALAGADRVHPADLWPLEHRSRRAAPLLVDAVPQPYGPEARARLDSAVLRIVKNADPAAAADLTALSRGFAAAQPAPEVRAFWSICAGFFEALAQGALEPDVYAKRVASRVLMQYATLAKGDASIAERLVQDLLFFCAQAAAPAAEAPALQAVRAAFGLQHHRQVNYEQPRFGRFDPAVLAQARKRIAAATETWSALAGGDRNKLKPAADQFSLVCDSLRKLHPDSDRLAQSMTHAIDGVLRSGEPPSAALAMEVATAVLYLQASLEDLDGTGAGMAQRATRLAERLDGVAAGGQSQPLESWMEELYRRVSDQQTMGSVVGELRATLTEAEKSMDQYFRQPASTEPLRSVPGRLQQMRGVLSVLGLDQASLAVLRMRDTVERLLINDIAEGERQPVFEKLGNSLGALGFLVDMLSYQRAMARKLFVYDEESGELRIVMGRARAPEAAAAEVPAAPPLPAIESPIEKRPQAPAAPSAHQSLAAAQSAAPLPESAPVPPPPAQEEDDGQELLDIFLEEAREVVATGRAAVKALHAQPGDLSEQTSLRRAFHTLKGSSRMVGLGEFGAAAWSMEQLLNAWLAEQKPMEPPLLQLAAEALQAFAQWADDIAVGRADHWQAQAFCVAADAMRQEGTLVPLATAAATQAAVEDRPAAEPHALDAPEEQSWDTEWQMPEPQALPLAAAEPEPAPNLVEDTIPLDIDRLLSSANGVPQQDFADTCIESFDLGGDTPAPRQEPAPDLLEEVDFALFEQALQASLAADAGTEPDEPPPQEPAEPLALDLVLDLPPQTQPAQELDIAPIEAAPEFIADATEPEPLPAAMPELARADAEESREPVVPASTDEAVKVIEHLRIGIPLYNVYLNEADEWSRRLSMALQEWALELHQPLPDVAVALAHSLAGSSATVGFAALSGMARTLEHALQHVQLLQGLPEHAQALNAAADDIRRLLHQFAAGFLKEPNAQVLERLEALLLADVSSGRVPLEVAAQDAADVAPEAAPAPQAVEPRDLLERELEVDEVIARAVAASVDDDDIDALDIIDPDLFPIFEEEALELLPALGAALRQWSARPENLGARNELLRALHTLKGSARLAGAMRLGEMAHRMEAAVECINIDGVGSADIEPLLASLDSLQAGFDALRTIGAQPLTAPVAVPSPGASEHVGAAAQALPLVHSSAPVATKLAWQAGAGTTPPARPAAGQTVRVRAQLLDRLVNQAGEVVIARSRLDARMAQMRTSLGDLTDNLERLRQQLRDIEVQAESQMQSRLALSKDSTAGFDPLEFDRFTRVQELTRMMAESVNDVATVQRNMQRALEGAEDDLVAQGRQARDLQRDLLHTRMVEFEGIAERLYAVVRQVSKETGKQIKLDIAGGSIEMDRGVLDRMTPAFEHLLRNCAGHGIEAPELRVAAGKPAVGTLTIALRQEGNDVSVEFRDDGAGLDLARIRAKALAQGLIAEDAQLSDAEVANLIFLPGLSTAIEVTGLSGRGIGMDVVRSEVQALGGRIETRTEAGQGSAFRLVLPLTTAVTQVVMLRAGRMTLGVPASLVEIVRRGAVAELDAAYVTHAFTDGQEQLPFYWAGALLQSSPCSTEAAGKYRPVLILRSAAQRIAMHVDEVLGNQEVVVKNLGPQLSHLPGLTGMSVLASGAVVLIYNPVALATVYGDQARAATRTPVAAEPAAAATQVEGGANAPAPLAADSQVPLILVVDDSITVRRVTQRLLQREGYRVALAADGLQALERLQQERPAVVLSDIEMPRMDGFDLARNIRGDAALRDLPIIMITSRIAQKHRDHAQQLGVNHYLGKPYSDEELLSMVQHYTQQAAQAAG